MSETSVTIEDCINYDDALSDNSSKYTLTNITSLTFSDNAYTVVSKASSTISNYFSLITFKDITLPSDFKISADLKFTHNSSIEDHHLLLGVDALTTNADTINGVSLGDYRTTYGLLARPWNESQVNRYSGRLSSNTWYTFELSYKNGVWTGTIITNDSVLWTGTITVSKTINHVGAGEAGNHNTYQFKNLKVKPL